MQTISAIHVKGRPQTSVEFWQGDLTRLDPRHRVDAVLVSAFPDDYSPIPGTLVGALHERGLSVDALAGNKDLDIRRTHSCWLSKPITTSHPEMPFRRIVCFEPEVRGLPPERVGDIFRALEWMIAVRPEIRSVAMPLVATGDAGFTVAEMLQPLLAAAVPWLEVGLGLDRLAIVAHSDRNADEARQIFDAFANSYTAPKAEVTDDVDFDVFLSYAHSDKETADHFAVMLRELRPGIRVFVDREILEVGMAWQAKIYDGLERSKYVVAPLSPAYLRSSACKEEFSIARLQGPRVGRDMLRPIYAFDADIPANMLVFQYLDAREGDPARLRVAAETIVSHLGRA